MTRLGVSLGGADTDATADGAGKSLWTAIQCGMSGSHGSHDQLRWFRQFASAVSSQFIQRLRLLSIDRDPWFGLRAVMASESESDTEIRIRHSVRLRVWAHEYLHRKWCSS